MFGGLGVKIGSLTIFLNPVEFRSVPKLSQYLNDNQMKNILKTSAIVILLLGSITTMNSCDKENEKVPTSPILYTLSLSEIGQTSAVSGGNITKDGGSEVTARGVCWSKDPESYNSLG